jgi:hypothetical protein
MRKDVLKKGAGSVGGIIGIILVILILLLGAYYFWKHTIEPRLNSPLSTSTPATSSTVIIQISATSS